MNLIGDTIYKSESNLSLEEYIYQLERNCADVNYSFTILRKNPWRCSLELKPWNELRLERNSFKQSIFMEIEVHEDKLDISTICRSPKWTLPIMIGFGIMILFLIIVLICMKTPEPFEVALYICGGCILMGKVFTMIMHSAKKTLKQLAPIDEDRHTLEKR